MNRGGKKRGNRPFQLEQGPEEQGKALKETGCWKRFPLGINVKAAAYGRGGQASLLKSEAEGIPAPPVIEDGWYYFANHHDQSVDRTNEEEFLERGSYNFVVAFYDAGESKLYYYQVDT